MSREAGVRAVVAVRLLAEQLITGAVVNLVVLGVPGSPYRTL
jgi:ABC-type uncharacterized transport system permease subunit